MSKQVKLDYDGQSVLQADYNTLGEAAARAEDFVFAELLRMTPFDGSASSKGILPYGHVTSGRNALIAANGASGSVIVNPFRAFVGSRTAVGTDAEKNWQDIRSALSVAAGATALTNTVNLTANSSGNPRWDAIYAIVSIDAASSPVTRKVKAPGTGVVTDQSVSVYTKTTLTIDKATGTPAASPVWPAIPSDTGSTYYVLLGYVRVPNGFNATSTVLKSDISESAKVLRIANVAGNSLSVADSLYNVSTAKQQAWGSSGTRPLAYLPATMSGAEGLLVTLQLVTGLESHATGADVDSRDWRGRYARWTANVSANGLITDGATPATANPLGTNNYGYTSNGGTLEFGMGASFADVTGGSNKAYIAKLDGTRLSGMADATSITLYVDMTTGKLKVEYTGAPNCTVLMWIDFSGSYANAL